MSLWDDFKDFVSSIGRSASAAPLSLAQGMVQQKATNAGMTPQGAADATQQAFTAGGVKPNYDLTEQTVTSLDKYVYQPTYEAAGFAALLANPDTYAPQQDEYTNAISRAWNERKDISFGQAIADNIGTAANTLPDWGPLADLNNVNINIYDAEMRDRVYARHYDEAGNRVDLFGNKMESASWSENVWRGISGGLDLGKQLVFDPLVGAGKVAKASRLKYLDAFRKETIVNTKDWNVHQEAHAAKNDEAFKAKAELVDVAPEIERTKSVVDQLDSMDVDSVRAEANFIREANNKKLLADNLDEQVYKDDIKSYYNSLETKVNTLVDKIGEINMAGQPKPNLAAGVSEFVDQIVDRQMTWREILAHKTIQDFAIDRPTLSYALEEAAKRGKAEVTDVLLLAQGDPGAYFRLRGRQDRIINMIDAAQTKADEIETRIQYALNNGDAATVARYNRQQAFASTYLKDLRAENQYLDRLVQDENGLMYSMTGVPVSSGKLSPIIEKYRADKAIVKAGLDSGTIKHPLKLDANKEFEWERIQRSPLHRPVYVAKWIGHKLGLEKPSGAVTVDGLDYYDGERELNAYLNNIKEFDNFPELKNKLLTKYVSQIDSNGRKYVLEQDVEREVFRTIASQFDGALEVKILDDGTTKEAWEIYFENYLKEKAKAVEKFRAERAFGIDANETIITNTVLESQLDYRLPMLDANGWRDYLAIELGDKTLVQANLRLMRQVKNEVIMPPLLRADKLWRADVLIRGGYTQRNILSELMIVSMHDVFGSMFMGPKVRKGVANWSANRYANLVDKGRRLQEAMDIAEGQDSSKIVAALRQLTPTSMKWNQFESLSADRIAKLENDLAGIKEFFDDIASQKEVLGIEVNHPAQAIAQLEAQILEEQTKFARVEKQMLEEEARLGRISAGQQAKGERFGTQRTRGDMVVRVGPYEFPGVYSGQQGLAAKKLASSGGRIGFDHSVFNQALKEMGLDTAGSWKKIDPTEDTYFVSLAKLINQTLRGSRTAMRVINGESDAQIIEYLKSPAGRKELDKIHWEQDILRSESKATKKRVAGRELLDGKIVQDRAENYLDFVKNQIVHNYLPSEEMLSMVRERLADPKTFVTTADLRLAARNVDLNPIYGEEVQTLQQIRNKMTSFERLDNVVFDRVIKSFYRALGEYPEDAIISTPFAQANYEAKLAEIGDTWKANNIIPSPAELAQAETAARKWAVSETRKYLYRVTRKNSISQSIPLLAPFVQAQISTFGRAGKLAYRNPDKAARLTWMYNQIQTNSYTDDQGERWLVWRVPASWYDDKGLSSAMPSSMRTSLAAFNDWRWNANAFNLLAAGLRVSTPELLDGQQESTSDKVGRWLKTAQSIAGTGPFAQIPANELLKAFPAMDQQLADNGLPLPVRWAVEIFASPYPSDKWYAPLMSAWNRRVETLVMGEGNNDFERTQLVLFQYHKDQIRQGLEEPLSKNNAENDELLMKRASVESSSFTFVRLMNNLSLGFIPTYEGPLTPYIKEYRKYQDKYGPKAYEQFVATYPDMGFITTSRSKNLTGSSATTESVDIRKKYNGVINKAIKESAMTREDALGFVQTVTTYDITKEAVRDPYATYWQKKMGDRLQLTAEEGYENQQIREGWSKFFNDSVLLDAELKKRGITKYSGAAAPLMEERNKRVEKIGKDYPAWYNRYTAANNADAAVGFVRFAKVMLNDDKFMSEIPKDSFWYDFKFILNERDKLVRDTLASGRKTPPAEWKEEYARRITPYLANETTHYYYLKFLDSDNFTDDTKED